MCREDGGELGKRTGKEEGWGRGAPMERSSLGRVGSSSKEGSTSGGSTLGEGVVGEGVKAPYLVLVIE